MKAFAKLVSETNDLAGQRELIAEYLQVDVMEPLKALARDIAAERKKHLSEGAELLRQLRVSMETLERVREGGGKGGRWGGKEEGWREVGREGERWGGREGEREGGEGGEEEGREGGEGVEKERNGEDSERMVEEWKGRGEKGEG